MGKSATAAAAAPPSRTPPAGATKSVYAENTQDGNGKFWAAYVNGTIYQVHFGKIGAPKGMAAKPKDCQTEEAALACFEKVVAEKTIKGHYVIKPDPSVGAAAAPTPAPGADKKRPLPVTPVGAADEQDAELEPSAKAAKVTVAA